MLLIKLLEVCTSFKLHVVLKDLSPQLPHLGFVLLINQKEDCSVNISVVLLQGSKTLFPQDVKEDACMEQYPHQNHIIYLILFFKKKGKKKKKKSPIEITIAISACKITILYLLHIMQLLRKCYGEQTPQTDVVLTDLPTYTCDQTPALQTLYHEQHPNTKQHHHPACCCLPLHARQSHV